MISITIPGEPQGKGRARAVIRRGKIGHYTPPKTTAYENKVRQAAIVAMRDIKPYEGPMRLAITALFEIPKSWPKWKKELALAGQLMPTGKPDLDNVAKAIKDGLNGIAWGDDSQVCAVAAEKRYASGDQPPHVQVHVTQMNAAPSNCDRPGVNQ